jgi:hypothetical protein
MVDHAHETIASSFALFTIHRGWTGANDARLMPRLDDRTPDVTTHPRNYTCHPNTIGRYTSSYYSIKNLTPSSVPCTLLLPSDPD